MSLSRRCLKGLQVNYESQGLNVLYAGNPYREDKNPEGFVRLSCADNILTQDILTVKFRSIDFKAFNEHEMFVYITAGGRQNTRQCFADLMNEFTLKNAKNPVKPEQLLLVSGTTMVCDLLGQILFDEDDVLLAHSPYYHRFPNDFADRGLIQIINVPNIKSASTKVVLDVELYEEQFQRCKTSGQTVKAILIVNPRNPDGGYFTLEEMKPIIEWAVKKHDLFVILDEIYDLAVYDPIENEPFESAIKIFDQDSSLDQNKLIWMSGLSKNFSLPGLRTAVMYTPNEQVYSATKRFLMYQGPNATTEFLTRQILEDKNWLREIFFPASHHRLKEARNKTVDWLQNLKNQTGVEIQWITPRAGFFILVDFSEFLDSKDFDGEQRLQKRFIDHKVLIVAGKQLAMEVPGWFRIVFCGNQWNVVDEGLKRLEKALTTLVH